MVPKRTSVKRTKLLALMTSWLVASVCNPIVAGQENSAKTQEEAEILKLSPFQVSAARDYGYRAANALSATGTGMAIIDTPVTINVVTRDFIDDLGTFNVQDALQYVAGVNTSYRNRDTVVVRGFSPGMRTEYGATGQAIGGGEFVERIEIMKGPNAIFFGRVAPGGVINTISKQPKFHQQNIFNVAYGSYDNKQVSLDLTGPLSSKLAYRLVGYSIDRGGYTDYTGDRGNGLKADLLFQPFSGTTVRLQTSAEDQKARRVHSPARTSSDYIRISSPKGVYDPTIVYNGISSSLNPLQWVQKQNEILKAAGATKLFAIDTYIPDLHPRGNRAHFDGPDAFKLESNRSFFSEIEQRFNDIFSAKLEYRHVTSSRETLESSWFPRLDGVSADQRPLWNGGGGETWSAETEWVADFDLGPISQRFLVGADYNDIETISWAQTLPPVTFDFSQGAVYRISEHVNLLRTSNASYVWSSNSGFYGVGVTQMFDKRFTLLYGARRTKVVQGGRLGSIAPSGRIITPYGKSGGRSQSDDTFQVGAVYKFTPQLSVFAGSGETYEPQTAVSVDGSQLDPVTGKGWEFGIKSDMREGRLAATLSIFRNERTGIANRDYGREILEGRAPYYIPGGSEASEGAEIEVFYAPAPNYQTTLAATHFWTSGTISNKANPYLVGRGLQFTPKTTISFWNRYTFSDGSLKNLTIGGGLRYNGSHEALANLDYFQIINPSWFRVDVLLAYETRLFGRKADLQLNAENLTNKLYYDGEYNLARPLNATFRVRFTF